MFIYGIVTAVEITSFNSFNDSDFIAGSVIFVIVGFMKVLASILGFAALYFEKKTLFAVVSSSYLSLLDLLYPLPPSTPPPLFLPLLSILLLSILPSMF